jgi:hypothetical protein
MSRYGKKSRAGVQKDPRRPRAERRRKISLRPQPGRDAGRTVATAQEFSSLARLIDALESEKIGFIVIGMTAGILQGVPVTSFDVDLWIDLPSRQYMRPMNLALKLGAQMVANTVAVLPGDLTVNFVYVVSGLKSFRTERRQARKLRWVGRQVDVLPLERLYLSKRIVGRPKDLAHLPQEEVAQRARLIGVLRHPALCLHIRNDDRKNLPAARVHRRHSPPQKLVHLAPRQLRFALTCNQDRSLSVPWISWPPYAVPRRIATVCGP